MNIKANALPFIRSAINLDQSSLAKKVGVTQSMISAVEKGKRPLSVGLERKIRSEIGLNDDMISRLTKLYREINNLIATCE
ncbi:helix-turn-helix transcriptional regulator [Bacillus sp. ISL-46]|uniref:helix-turn-helix transcriptional regulator n=1 Tax=Bacillus sp. ISL-46 TaxID=2819129 RepID=UPI001BEC0ACF|nr:helix-turn-helix transcriptional regulator [Bacillus sp. ISL-46]MBT2722860.1 helix-turn-helix transcriptional regulator [Bacillus sp. ISL-46]